jgi:hypothetical protein
MHLITTGTNAFSQNPMADYDRAGIFEALANEDYEGAFELARVVSNTKLPEPRT